MAIAFDTANNTSGAGPLITLAHTCTGSNRVLFVFVQNAGTTSIVSTLTYAGVSMTLINTLNNTTNGAFLSLYGLIAPASGSNNIVLTTTGAGADVDSASYTGVSQTSLSDNTTTNSTSSGTTFATTLSTVANNCWAILCVVATHGTVQNGTNAVLRTNSSTNVGLYDTGAAVTPAGSITMTASITGASSAWGTVMNSFAPFVATPANANFLTFM